MAKMVKIILTLTARRCFCDICGRGSAGAGELSVEHAARIPAASAVVTDGHKSYGFPTRG